MGGFGPRQFHSLQAEYMRRRRLGIIAAGMTQEVTFEATEGATHDRIDDAYRAKDRNSPYLEPVIGIGARSATIKIMPREIRNKSVTSK